MEVTINYNGQAVAVEVTLEVYEFLDRADHKAENLSHEQRRHWDGREFDEYIVSTEGAGIYGETPEEYLCRMETLGELMAVLDTCTEAQRRRFLLYALDGLTLAEIGTVCGCSKVSVYESIDAVRKKFLKFFANYPRVYLKTPQRCSILPKSPICCVAFACIPWRSAALMRLASGAFWRISQHF